MGKRWLQWLLIQKMTPYVFSANESFYDNLTKFLDYRVLAGLVQKDKMSGNALLSGKFWKCMESVWIFDFLDIFVCKMSGISH